jgi:DNA-binding NarL/FixJ family response regulator
MNAPNRQPELTAIVDHKSSIAICIVANDDSTRESIVKSVAPQFDLEIRQFDDIATLLKAVYSDEPSICLVRRSMDSETHMDEYSSISDRYKEISLILIQEFSAGNLAQSISAGFRGFAGDDVGGVELTDAIKSVHGGSIWMARALDETLKTMADGYQCVPEPAEQLILSKRELQVLQYITEGLTNGEIATRLFLSVGTIKVSVRSLFSKLHVTDRTQAAVAALKDGLIFKEPGQ